MILFKKVFLFAFLIFSGSVLNAQDIVTKLMSTANRFYSKLQYSNALAYYEHAYTRAEKSATGSFKKEEAAAKIADCYWLMRNYERANAWYSKLSTPSVTALYRKAELSAILGNYAEAVLLLKLVVGFEERAKGFSQTDDMKKDSADWSISYLDGINTDYFREFSPVLVDSAIFWTTNQPRKYNKYGVMAWDNMGYNRMVQFANAESITTSALPTARKLYDPKKLDSKQPSTLALNYSLSDFELLRSVKIPNTLLPKIKAIDTFTKPVLVDEKFSYNIAHATYSGATGKIYFSANRQGKLKNKLRTIGIVESNRTSTGISGSKFIFADGNEHSFMHPAISSNGAVLVFSSNMAGGEGGFDLYIAEKTTDSTWGTPVSLKGINSLGNELFPSFGPNGTLFFSTDGHPGLGGLDIYKADLKDNVVSNVQHISWPINSSYDDFGIAVKPDMTSGYFTSDRLGSDDIYKFVFEKKVVKISGLLKSEETNNGKQGIKVVMFEKNEKGDFLSIDSTYSDASGKYSLNGRPNREYRFSIKDPSGDHTTEVSTINVFTDKSLSDIVLKDKKSGVVTEPTNSVSEPKTFKYIVYFDFNQYKITAESAVVLEEVKLKMSENADYKCSLYGHTDVLGEKDYNKKLSYIRAKTVRNFLHKKGVDQKRLDIYYFGEEFPVIDTNDKREAEKNRRVEIEITK